MPWRNVRVSKAEKLQKIIAGRSEFETETWWFHPILKRRERRISKCRSTVWRQESREMEKVPVQKINKSRYHGHDAKKRETKDLNFYKTIIYII
jgi:hypothetical protein